jgi:hypothetical protein
VSRDNIPTLILCLACGGEYEKVDEQNGAYRMTRCRWCTYGGMDRAQQQRWIDHVKRRSSGQIKLKLPPDDEG